MKRIFIDQMNRKVEVPFPPKRIVSLVPSQTELLYDLGLNTEVVGQTLFCIHPTDMHQSKPRVGGTKNVKHDIIEALHPDLIIGNKEENNQADIEALAKIYPVWMSDIQTLDDAMQMIEQVGELVNKPTEAKNLVQQIQQSFSTISSLQLPTSTLQPLTSNLRTAYLIWRKPWMAAGHDTFINDMLNRLGLLNVFQHEHSRYPEITAEQLSSTPLDVILLSSEPYPFKEKHIDELQQLCPQAKIILVDGELFSWYGSRLLHSAKYFNELLLSIPK